MSGRKWDVLLVVVEPHSQPQPRLEKCDVETVFACWLVPSRAQHTESGTTQGVLWRLVRGIFSISPVTRKPVPAWTSWSRLLLVFPNSVTLTVGK